MDQLFSQVVELVNVRRVGCSLTTSSSRTKHSRNDVDHYLLCALKGVIVTRNISHDGTLIRLDHVDHFCVRGNQSINQR